MDSELESQYVCLVTRRRLRALTLAIAGLLTIAGFCSCGGSGSGSSSSTTPPPTAATLTVSGTPWGTSTQYIGANEGDQYFNINDFKDLGINSYRIYGSVPPWEPEPDSGTPGSPTMAQVEANPNVINWTFWDNIMTNPPAGSEYSYVGDSNVWQGSASTIFATLQANNIRPIVVLRPTYWATTPVWAETWMNPPSTSTGQNAWWEHVFAVVYWLNVRNNYHVDDWEIHNEPDTSSQGWDGTLTDYESFVKLTSNAINYVYSTYLPGRTPHIYAPVTTDISTWPESVMQADAGEFDSVDIHDYFGDTISYISQVHGWMNSNGYSSAPLWVTEWGSDSAGSYSDPGFGVGTIINNLIWQSEPGNNYVYGSEFFSLYDWGSSAVGLIGPGDTPRTDYYAMRMAIRGLQGGRTTYQTTCSNGNLNAITTKDSSGHYWVLFTNTGSSAVTTTLNMSALLTTGSGTMWQFDASHNDVVVGTPTLSGGTTTISVAANAGYLIEF